MALTWRAAMACHSNAMGVHGKTMVTHGDFMAMLWPAMTKVEQRRSRHLSNKMLCASSDLDDNALSSLAYRPL